MDSAELNRRLVAVGDKIKAKGWNSVSIHLYVSYLGIFDRATNEFDPMISYRPSITATVRYSESRIGESVEYVRDAWDIKTLDAAVDALDLAAEAMLTMQEQIAQTEAAKAKLSAEDRRLLGVR